jgi:carbon dioxide concentrating mechanism protein CcmO
MESYQNGIVSQNSLMKRDADNGRRKKRVSQTALGLVSTLSFPTIVSTADAMLKAASVTLIGYEKTGSGHCTAIVRGSISEVRIAVEAGVEHAKQEGRLLSSLVLPRPFANLEAIFPIGDRLFDQMQQDNTRVSNLAIGLLETRGFPAMVAAADAMVKAADVQFTAYETIGDALCTAIIRGKVANVAMALQVGMAEVQRMQGGELVSIAVITRPLEDLEKTLPLASCLIEDQPQPLMLPVEQPLMLPVEIKETEKELVELPDLAKLPLKIEEYEE